MDFNFDINSCIHCNKCTQSCKFLTKYKLDLKGFNEQPELANSCFMCRACSIVCPKNIRGEEIALALRKQNNKINNEQKTRKDFKWLIWEKEKYKFANYKRAHQKSVIMPGCNFSGFFPKTTKKIYELAKQNKMGILFECCGKPAFELGLDSDIYGNSVSMHRLENNLKKQGVEEIVCICPNCYRFMKEKTTLKVTSIYDKLKEIDYQSNFRPDICDFFIPCPDKETHEFLNSILDILQCETSFSFSNIQCCGLGGCANLKELDLAKDMLAEIKSTSQGTDFYTYCASCICNFHRFGIKNSYHILPLILGVEEEVPTGIQPFFNKLKFKLF